MIRAKKIIREGQVLLETEIITLVRQGKTMNTEDRVFGYVVNVDDDTMLEVEVKSLAIVNDKLHAFMARVDDRDYSEEEALKMLKERSGLFLPGWFALDEGFYGLLLPTMMNIAEALDLLKRKQIMKKVKIGDTIRIIRMNDDGGKDLQARMYNGRSGVVEHIDSKGQLHGTWGGLAVIPGVDEIETLKG